MSFQLFTYICIYFMLLSVIFYIRLSSLKVALDPNKIMNMSNFKFCFDFRLKYALSLTIPLYVFDLSFLKIILEVLFMAFYSAKYTFQYIVLYFQNNTAAHSLFLSHPYIPIFNLYFFHVVYAIYIINVFHSVNLTSRTLTSIHNIQKMDQKQLETLKQDERCSVTSTRTIQKIDLKEKETELISKNV